MTLNRLMTLCKQTLAHANIILRWEEIRIAKYNMLTKLWCYLSWFGKYRKTSVWKGSCGWEERKKIKGKQQRETIENHSRFRSPMPLSVCFHSAKHSLRENHSPPLHCVDCFSTLQYILASPALIRSSGDATIMLGLTSAGCRPGIWNPKITNIWLAKCSGDQSWLIKTHITLDSF